MNKFKTQRTIYLFSLFFIIVVKVDSYAGDSSILKKPQLILIKQYASPVITTRSPGAEGNAFGFEGGRAVKIANTYHLFTSEMVKDPVWVTMKFGYWQSHDRINWKRVSTIRQSSGNFTATDPRAALWSPLPVFDTDENRWNLFYVGYRSAPNEGPRLLINHEGRIWRAVSEKKGIGGIGGPYKDAGIVLQPGKESQAWEGLQGTDSFFPWEVNGKWYAFYGSARTEKKPIEYWLVGLASAPSLKGPWKRLPHGNPLSIEKKFIENPIITPLKNGGWLTVYDVQEPDAIGWAYSKDGIHWSAGNNLKIQTTKSEWSKEIRTPMGLIDEGNNRFTLFYTGFEQAPDWERLLQGKGKETCAIGFVELIFKKN
ncbi:MAG TPA: hypothetical protein VMY77_05350 [Chitinophagaceae bacterium]|nr:hypothetical protein [Chitinophagaceae bacterium]